MLTLKVISFIFSVISVLFLLSCVNFGIRTNIDLSEASHSQSRTRKKNFTTKKKKKKPSPLCFLHQQVISVIFLLGPRKLPFSCVSQYKKKRWPTQTHQPPDQKQSLKVNESRQWDQAVENHLRQLAIDAAPTMSLHASQVPSSSNLHHWAPPTATAGKPASQLLTLAPLVTAPPLSFSLVSFASSF